MQLKAEYEELLKRHNYTYNTYAAFTYDAAWSIALMLNKSIPLLQEKNLTLETMSYRDKEAAKVMRDTLFRTDFWGMSVCTFVMLLYYLSILEILPHEKLIWMVLIACRDT